MKAVHTVIPVMETAVANRKAKEGLIFHSGRGVQYCAKSFRETLGELCPSVRRSMSRKGELLGQRLRRIVFQDPEEGVGNGGRQNTAGEVTSSLIVSTQRGKVHVLSAPLLKLLPPHLV
jgi:hypothetical protein